MDTILKDNGSSLTLDVIATTAVEEARLSGILSVHSEYSSEFEGLRTDIEEKYLRKDKVSVTVDHIGGIELMHDIVHRIYFTYNHVPANLRQHAKRVIAMAMLDVVKYLEVSPKSIAVLNLNTYHRMNILTVKYNYIEGRFNIFDNKLHNLIKRCNFDDGGYILEWKLVCGDTTDIIAYLEDKLNNNSDHKDSDNARKVLKKAKKLLKMENKMNLLNK